MILVLHFLTTIEDAFKWQNRPLIQFWYSLPFMSHNNPLVLDYDLLMDLKLRELWCIPGSEVGNSMSFQVSLKWQNWLILPNSNIPPSTLLRNDQPMLVMDVLSFSGTMVQSKFQSCKFNKFLSSHKMAKSATNCQFWIFLTSLFLPCYIITDLC
jgi:hypothetical protein